MKFNLTDRTLMKMLFERGMVTEITGVYTEGHHERRWEIIRRPANLFRDKEYFTASVSSIYETAQGATLDEALDALEAMIAEYAAA